MQPDELLNEMARAETLDEISTSLFEARVWLLDHPDDSAVRSAMEPWCDQSVRRSAPPKPPVRLQGYGV